MDFELWTIDPSKSSNLQTTAGGPNDEQAELQLKELEAEDLWPVLNEEDKKREKQMGDNKEFEVKAQTRKQGGNGTIQQMATESRSGQKNKKIKNVRNGSLVYAQTGTFADPTVRCFKASFDLCTFVRFFGVFQEDFSSCNSESSQSRASG